MNTAAAKPAPPNFSLVMWVMWAAMISGLVALQFMLGGGWPQGKNPSNAGTHPVAILGIVFVLIATAVRWFLLPRQKAMNQKLVMMIIGLALSEGAGINGIFRVPATQPETKLAIFVLAFLGMVQFVPIYARTEPRATFR